jgi:hypothetical protein
MIIGEVIDGSQRLEQQRWHLTAACGRVDKGSPELASELSEVPFYMRFGPMGAAHREELT